MTHEVEERTEDEKTSRKYEYETQRGEDDGSSASIVTVLLGWCWGRFFKTVCQQFFVAGLQRSDVVPFGSKQFRHK